MHSSMRGAQKPAAGEELEVSPVPPGIIEGLM